MDPTVGGGLAADWRTCWPAADDAQGLSTKPDLQWMGALQMKPAALVATLFLSLVAVLHLLRLLF
jgi:hypothetical protein